MLTNSMGKPIEFIITLASVADITALKVMEVDLGPARLFMGTKHLQIMPEKMI